MATDDLKSYTRITLSDWGAKQERTVISKYKAHYIIGNSTF